VDFRVMDRRDWLLALLDGHEAGSGALQRMLRMQERSQSSASSS